MLRYWLDVETRGSASLLDIERFDDPWNYTLKIAQGSAAETRPVTVDLVETFNYLIGLRVRHVDVIRGVTMVQGTLPSGEKALVIWRKVADMQSEELDRFLFSQSINPRDMEFDVIYVNGDNHLENTRRPDETWKVRQRLVVLDWMLRLFEVDSLDDLLDLLKHPDAEGIGEDGITNFHRIHRSASAHPRAWQRRPEDPICRTCQGT